MEIWKTIEGFENYQVSNLGRVKSLNYKRTNSEKILSPASDSRGYLSVFLCNDKLKKSIRIHRLVAICFIENKENKKTVNHINGIKTDNRIENLEWTTYKENQNHADLNGLRKVKGSMNKMSKLTEKNVLDIRKIKTKRTLKSLALEYNVSLSLIHRVIKRKCWTHI